MISRKDFINAIGEPDVSFEAAVSSALSIVRGMESTEISGKKRRHGMIFPAAAAAVILIAFIGFAVNGLMSEKPDPIKAPGAFSQPRETVTLAPEITAEAEINPEVTAEPCVTVEQTMEAAPPIETTWSADAPETAPTVQATIEAEQPYEDVIYDESGNVSVDMPFWDGFEMSEDDIDCVNYAVDVREEVSRPGYYDLFEKAFGQGLDDLLEEGYSYEETWLTDKGSLLWIVGDGAEQYTICRLFEEDDGVIFMLYMPYSDVCKISSFMDSTPEWLAILYYDEAAVYIADAIGTSETAVDLYTLNTLTVEVDDFGQPLMVNMCFDMEYVVNIVWAQRDEGSMELAGAYVDGLLVYGYDTGFDAYNDAAANND